MYILTFLLIICGCFYLILHFVAQAMGSSNGGGSLVQVSSRFPFATVIFCSWDYSMHSEQVRRRGSAT